MIMKIALRLALNFAVIKKRQKLHLILFTSLFNSSGRVICSIVYRIANRTLILYFKAALKNQLDEFAILLSDLLES